MILNSALEGIIWNPELSLKANQAINPAGLLVAVDNEIIAIAENGAHHYVNNFNLLNAALKTGRNISCLAADNDKIYAGFGDAIYSLDLDENGMDTHLNISDVPTTPYNSIAAYRGQVYNESTLSSQLLKNEFIVSSLIKIYPEKEGLLLLETGWHINKMKINPDDSPDFLGLNSMTYIGVRADISEICENDGEIFYYVDKFTTAFGRIMSFGSSERDWYLNRPTGRRILTSANGLLFDAGDAGTIFATEPNSLTSKTFTSFEKPIQAMAAMPLDAWKKFARLGGYNQ